MKSYNLNIQLLRLEMKKKKESIIWFVAIIVVALIGIFAVYKLLVYEDSKLRQNHLTNAIFISKIIQNGDLFLLSGTKDDINNPFYKQVKSRAYEIFKINKKYRSIYGFKRNEEGALFFLFDCGNIAKLRKKEANPGDIYKNAPQGFLDVFDEQKPVVVGPYTDEWGTFVSALVPVVNPNSGEIVGAICVDIDASTWYFDVVSSSALPIAVVFIFVIVFLYRNMKNQAKITNILKENEEKYRRLANNINDVVITLNLEKQITFVSPSVFKTFGFTISEYKSKSLSNLFTEHSCQKIEKALEELLEERNGKNRFIEVEHYKADGSKIWVSLNISLLYDEDNEVQGFIGTIRDIHSRKIAEQQLQEINKKLENIIKERTKELNDTLQLLEESNYELKMLNEYLSNESKKLVELNEKLMDSEQQLRYANETKDMFFSIIAHDLRNPFVTLINNAELLDRFYEKMSDSERKKAIHNLKNASKNTYHLLDNLLVWSSSQMGTIEFTPYEFNLKKLLLEVKLISQPQATAKNIEVDIEVPDDIMVFADENMLGAVYRNLVTNAIKFTHRGGHVLLGCKPAKKSEICLFVKDTGIGIDEDNLPKLFSLDKKISRPGTEGELSTGLGLIVCKEFINKHGGEIWAESEIGKGTTFYFTLPIKDAAKN